LSEPIKINPLPTVYDSRARISWKSENNRGIDETTAQIMVNHEYQSNIKKYFRFWNPMQPFSHGQ